MPANYAAKKAPGFWVRQQRVILSFRPHFGIWMMLLTQLCFSCSAEEALTGTVHPGASPAQAGASRSAGDPKLGLKISALCYRSALISVYFFSILSSKQIKSNSQVQFVIAHTRVPRTESAEGSVATGVNCVLEQTRRACRR